ncbi:hypothetical protein MVEN_02528200 [Mycena venus]|uniref:Uncharacterized protein n=1 Tax=Mycena venus TaxID=2733690 RepID=A0A8H6WUR3_9AGAR|nr:hypothetical protein MVEN_02528200 [Mycena venus]
MGDLPETGFLRRFCASKATTKLFWVLCTASQKAIKGRAGGGDWDNGSGWRAAQTFPPQPAFPLHAAFPQHPYIPSQPIPPPHPYIPSQPLPPPQPCVCNFNGQGITPKNVDDMDSHSEEEPEEPFDGIVERKEHYLIREQLWYPGLNQWVPYDFSRYEIPVPKQDLGTYFYVNIRHQLPGGKFDCDRRRSVISIPFDR